VVAAIVILGCLMAVFGVLAFALFLDVNNTDRRISDLENQVRQQAARINVVAGDVRTSHAQLVDGLWKRASAEVDQEIERARARGRGF
jgi:hypothetical protein